MRCGEWESDAARTLRSPALAARIPPHRDGLLVLAHILEVLERPLQVAAVNGLCRLARVLEGDAEVGAAAAGGL